MGVEAQRHDCHGLGAANLDVLRQLPRGTGVVLRQCHPDAKFLTAAKTIARARGLICLVSAQLANRGNRHWPEAMLARPHRKMCGQVMTSAAHSRRAILQARRCRMDAVFVSPMFATASHPGSKALGRVRLGLMVRDSGMAVIALGGITPKSLYGLRNFPLHGVAAITGWLGA
jgi:thiamine-phosphate pyrophosphorylase